MRGARGELAAENYSPLGIASAGSSRNSFWRERRRFGGLVGWLCDPLRVINSDRIPSMEFFGTAVRVRKEYANGMRLLGRGVRYHSLNNKRRKMTRTMACSFNANGRGVLFDHMYISFML